jgi:HPt (histidine-containing phosphotransfer) domain-containing protein
MKDRTLLSIYHEDAFYQPLLEKFSKNIGSYESKLTDAVAQKEHEQVRNIAHEIKGVFGAYGFPQIAELANLVQVSYDGSPSMEKAAAQLIELVQRVKETYQS